MNPTKAGGGRCDVKPIGFDMQKQSWDSVVADGLFLAGDEAFRGEIEALTECRWQRLGIRRTPGGWRIAHPHLLND
jgi:hypothetical protein